MCMLLQYVQLYTGEGFVVVVDEVSSRHHALHLDTMHYLQTPCITSRHALEIPLKTSYKEQQQACHYQSLQEKRWRWMTIVRKFHQITTEHSLLLLSSASVHSWSESSQPISHSKCYFTVAIVQYLTSKQASNKCTCTPMYTYVPACSLQLYISVLFFLPYTDGFHIASFHYGNWRALHPHAVS